MRLVREVGELEWERFVDKSPQGTVFSTARWMRIFNRPYKIYGYYKGDDLVGGIAGFTDDGFESGSILTPFQGFLLKPMDDMKQSTVISQQDEILGALTDYLISLYSTVKITSHYTLNNLRALIWRGFSQSVKYTYVVDLTDPDLWGNLEKQTRYEINRMKKLAPEVRSGDLRDLTFFDNLYGLTFERKGLTRPVNRQVIEDIFLSMRADMFIVGNSAVAIMTDEKRAYYILGASDGGNSSYLALWHGMEVMSRLGFKEIDLVGCNDRQIDLFKRGFGGRLEHYFQCIKQG